MDNDQTYARKKKSHEAWGDGESDSDNWCLWSQREASLGTLVVYCWGEWESSHNKCRRRARPIPASASCETHNGMCEKLRVFSELRYGCLLVDCGCLCERKWAKQHTHKTAVWDLSLSLPLSLSSLAISIAHPYCSCVYIAHIQTKTKCMHITHSQHLMALLSFQTLLFEFGTFLLCDHRTIGAREINTSSAPSVES